MAVLYQGKLVTHELSLPFNSPALNWGRAFFETILYDRYKLFYYEDHLNRIRRTCDFFKIDLDFSQINEGLVRKLIVHNHEADHASRVKILYLNSRGDEWVTAVYTAPYVPRTKPLKLVVHPELRDSLFRRFKSANYFENLYWKEHYTKELGTNEVLFLNSHRNIVEGSYSNIFCVKDRVLYGVGADNPCLPGITAARIVRGWQRIGFKEYVALEKGFSLDFLHSVDEIFMTNSLMQALEVSMILYPGMKNIRISPGEWAARVREYLLQ